MKVRHLKEATECALKPSGEDTSTCQNGHPKNAFHPWMAQDQLHPVSLRYPPPHSRRPFLGPIKPSYPSESGCYLHLKLPFSGKLPLKSPPQTAVLEWRASWLGVCFFFFFGHSWSSQDSRASELEVPSELRWPKPPISMSEMENIRPSPGMAWLLAGHGVSYKNGVVRSIPRGPTETVLFPHPSSSHTTQPMAPLVFTYLLSLENNNNSSCFSRSLVSSCNAVLFFSEDIFWEGKLSVGFFSFSFFSFKLNIIFCSTPASVLKAFHPGFHEHSQPFWKVVL